MRSFNFLTRATAERLVFMPLLVFNIRPINPLKNSPPSANCPASCAIGKSAGSWFSIVNAENFYIVATAPNDSSLQVRISGPYLTEQAARADLEAAIAEAADIDPSAKGYKYTISKVESRKPGVIQHMAAHG